MSEEIERVGAQPGEPQRAHDARGGRRRLALALIVAAASDAISFWAELFPLVQWAVDLATAIALFAILGRRWAILPGLIAEAIPGLAAFPMWVLVVVSIFFYDGVKARRSESRG